MTNSIARIAPSGKSASTTDQQVVGVSVEAYEALRLRMEYIHAVLLREDLTAPQKCMAVGVTLHADDNLENSAPGNRLLGRYASLRKEEAITECIRAIKERRVVANRDPSRGHTRVFRLEQDAVTEAVMAMRETLPRLLTRQSPDPAGLRVNGRYLRDHPPERGVLPPPLKGGTLPPLEGGTSRQLPPLRGGTLMDPPPEKGGTPGTPVSGGYPPSENDPSIYYARARGLDNNTLTTEGDSTTSVGASGNVGGARKRATRKGASTPRKGISDDWQPAPTTLTWALKRFDIRKDQLAREVELFRARHLANGATFANWEQAFRHWCGKNVEAGPYGGKPKWRLRDAATQADLSALLVVDQLPLDEKPMSEAELDFQRARADLMARRKR